MATSVATGTRPFTYDDLLEFPEGDGYRYEIIGGELFVAAAPGLKHQRLGIRLVLLFGNHVAPRDLGEVLYAPVDVRLQPHDIVEPDILFIRKDRLGIVAGNVVEGPPDLVVEILSPSTRNRDLTLKLGLYATNGVLEYWVVDPVNNTVLLHVLSGTEGYLRVEPVDGLIRSTVLPELVINVNALFADLD